MSPIVSIIIPTFNRAKELKRAISSIYSQTFTDWEVIVVDNNSNDGTYEYIKNIDNNKIRFFSIQNDGVIASSRNLGINNAQGKYIAFLDSDDWWDPNKLEISIKYLINGASIVYHDLYRVKKSQQIFHFRKSKTRNLSRPVFDDLLANGWALNNSSVVILRSLLEQIGGLSINKNLVGAEDYDAWLKISQLTEDFIRIPKTLGYYWEGGGNTSNPLRKLKNIREIESIYKEKIEYLKLSQFFYHNDFVNARANYLIGNYDLSKKYLDVVLNNKIPFMFYIKSKILILLIILKKYDF